MIPKLRTGIREFRIDDLGRILEIEGKAFPKSAYPADLFMHYARKCAEGFFVVEHGKEVVGYILFDRGGHIHSMAVVPEQRRRGFGRMLFEHAGQGSERRLWLEVRSRNGPAIEFYKKMGMAVVGKIADYYETDDALVMISKGVRSLGLSACEDTQRVERKRTVWFLPKSSY
jgi:ribosomal-protein-alanine N-acetyltransferase